MKVVVIVPVYNEMNRAVETIQNIKKYFDGQIVVIDDGSSDGSLEVLNKAFKSDKEVCVLTHLINLGKGAAMKTGAEMAWSMGAEAAIFVDADGQHDPKHLPYFIKKLKKSPIVFGYRVMNKDVPLVRRWGNIFATNFIKVLFNIKKKDLLSGYLGFRKEVYNQIVWTSCRYGIETEMATKIGKNKLPFSEIKIDTIYIDKYKGVTLLDAIKILGNIPYWYFSK